ncbi:tripartite tricarboxylate transporter substrate binding protein [Pararhodobacter sp. CCB-MM2]|uniref:tripartite tricarboxylate transporter substrate binding protein n=1 Tax=Pararhodobacter sp. CCB-MM2 TaxID=1786003 RepID=UPI00082C925D|nr:tripartite tricarboxylate transporter substrate binding protein [Pararhodobacter sp. CCB-MM2]
MTPILSPLKPAALGVTLSLAALAPAFAQDYPTQNIDLVVPFAPGGAVDTTARLIADAANAHLDGVEIQVSNRAGGGGIVGQNYVAQAEPDGYTVLAITSSVVTNPRLSGAPYAITDFTPVAAYNLDPQVIAVPADSRFASIEDFVAAATEAPLTMSVAGIGTSHHMSGLALEAAGDMQFTYLPSNGFGQQLQMVLGGHVDGAFWPLGEAASHAQGGTVRLLAVAAEERDPNFPDVPTFEEAGLGLPLWATFRGLAVPAGTPDEVVAFLSDLMQTVAEDEGFQQRFTEAGYTVSFRPAARFAEIINAYDATSSAIIEEHGLGQ